MRSHELTTGRQFGVIFDHGEDFFTSLESFCRDNAIQQAYIPMFLAGFVDADIVGTYQRLDDPQAPVWDRVHVCNVEALGCGTIAYDPDEDRIKPHIHVSLGLKERSADAHTSHLLDATVQFLTEMLLVEVSSPTMRRPRQPDLYDVPLLRFD